MPLFLCLSHFVNYDTSYMNSLEKAAFKTLLALVTVVLVLLGIWSCQQTESTDEERVSSVMKRVFKVESTAPDYCESGVEEYRDGFPMSSFSTRNFAG